MTTRSRGEDSRRHLPSVDELLRRDDAGKWVERWGREPVTRALRDTVERARRALEAGEAPPDSARLVEEAARRLSADRPSLRAVVNGTGVILHTNLGRAPLAAAASRMAAEIAAGYSSLEYDLQRGERGDRYSHCADLVSGLVGAESSLVVNNNAAAVSLAINTLARGREVIVSRGELVEIGGGFRIPEVIERSGAHLCAVGTTNRTRLDDYRRAITPSTGMLLKIHPSNYRVDGFVEEASLDSLVDLGRASDLPVMHDVGSGLLIADDIPGMHEPSVRDSVASGADLVTWSGDKLLGGPQAGIVHGRAATVDRLRANPLLRAFRVDKMTLAALETTLRLYLSPERARKDIPVLRMLTEAAHEVEARAWAAVAGLSTEAAKRVSVVEMRSVLGGGAAPGFDLPSAGWVVSGRPAALESALRSQDPPVIGRIENGALLLDFRTVLDGQEALLIRALERLLLDEVERG